MIGAKERQATASWQKQKKNKQLRQQITKRYGDNVKMEESFRKKVKQIAKKNKICRWCMLPVLFVGVFLFQISAYLKGNAKRFSMIGMTLLLFVVYSSFSFPAFVDGNGSSEALQEVSEEAQYIVLAEEAEINLAELKWLDDNEVKTENEEADMPHGLDIEAKYSASDILASTPSSGAEKETGTPESASAFSKDDWKLVLINKQHSIPDDYEFPLGNIQTMKGSMQCDERIIDDLLAMLQAAKEDKITLAICSPYRDLEYQEMLFNRKIKRYMNMGMSYLEAYQLSSQAVTVPGASEHQIGLALDIVTDSYTSLNEGFGETPAGIWLAENSYKYGFILRYPKGKEYITGIEYEPWHFRYVGVDAATVITENGITLEEFWEDL